MLDQRLQNPFDNRRVRTSIDQQGWVLELRPPGERFGEVFERGHPKPSVGQPIDEIRR
jgi:hypothetical protein